MIVYSLAKWKEITKGTSSDQVDDILRSWEAQNRMLQWELLQLEELFGQIHGILDSAASEVDLIRGTNDWTPPDLEEEA